MHETDISPEEILTFWEEAGPEKWYKQDDAFDAEIRARFGDLWEAARAGKAGERWSTAPRGALARIIMLDQFPRNMFRGDARAFATDAKARSVAIHALDRGWDLKIEGALRQFFYMPFMHSEKITDQDHCVRLMKERMPEGNNLLHARAHREVIRRFSRFPYRNDALGRKTTHSERAFLDNGGYGEIVRELDPAGAA